MKQMSKNPKNKRRGVTMVEVVVALVMISVVSAATLSIVMRSIHVESNAVTVLSVKNNAENVLNCFRYSQDEVEFLEALSKTAPFEMDEEGHFVVTIGDYTAVVSADFTTDSFVYTATRSDGELLYTFQYPRFVEEGGEGG